MGFVQLTQVSVYFGERTIFDNLSLFLDTNSKVSLTGPNGSGKSTLMKIISQEQEIQGGTVSKTPNLRIAYLPQTGITYKELTLREVGLLAFAHLQTLANALSAIESQLAETSSTEALEAERLETERLLAQHHTLQEQLYNSAYYQQDEMVSRVFVGLGFTLTDLEKPCSTFSGGWQMRIALGKVLLEEPDLMLLDEPTNYLDLEARLWLEGFLNTFSGGCMVVSHDRDFLDAITHEVYDIDNQSIVVYKGNYSDYRESRKVRIAQLMQEKARQEREKARLQDFIERFRAKDSKAAQVRDRIKKLERMKEIEIPEARESIHFSFPQPPRSGDMVLQIEGLKKSYGAHQVFSDLHLEVNRGDRLVLLGKNGAGKSTLMKILSGALEADHGHIQWGAKVYSGYFSQESDLPEGLSIYDAAMEAAPSNMGNKIRSILGAFLFSGDDIYKETGVLSGGEESRLRLLRLLLQPVNLLILDEPTNHLDLQAKEILLQALQEFTGTLIFVSHDLYFIKKLANRVLVMDTAPPTLYLGDYAYYQWRQSQEAHVSNSMATPNTAPKSTAANKRGSAKEDKPVHTRAKLSHQAQKERKNKLQRAIREELKITELLEQAEEHLQELTKQLATPEVYSNHQKALHIEQEIVAEKEKIQEIHEQWESVVLEIEELK